MKIRDANLAKAVRTVHYVSILGIGPGAYSQRKVEAWASGCVTADYTAGIKSDVID